MSESRFTMRHFEAWVDRQIREARERGEFDNLAGSGKPLPDLDGNHDEMWWVKQLLRREELSITPPGIALKKQVRELRETLAAVAEEPRARKIVEDLNAKIRQANRIPTDGPPTTQMPLDVEEIIARWRSDRAGGDPLYPV